MRGLMAAHAQPTAKKMDNKNVHIAMEKEGKPPVRATSTAPEQPIRCAYYHLRTREAVDGSYVTQAWYYNGFDPAPWINGRTTILKPRTEVQRNTRHRACMQLRAAIRRKVAEGYVAVSGDEKSMRYARLCMEGGDEQTMKKRRRADAREQARRKREQEITSAAQGLRHEIGGTLRLTCRL